MLVLQGEHLRKTIKLQDDSTDSQLKRRALAFLDAQTGIGNSSVIPLLRALHRV